MPDELQTPEDQPQVQLAPPPTWADVKATPGFAELPAEKQLVAFARWHDDAFNYASQQEDWGAVKDQFNTKAAQAQAALQTAAGGLSPNDARVKIATDALAAAGPATPDDHRAVLQALPKDVVGAYFDKQREPYQLPDKSIVGKIWDWDKNIFKNTVATLSQAEVGVAKAIWDMATPNVQPQQVNPDDPAWVQNLTQWSNEKSQAAVDWMKEVSGLLGETKKQVPAGIGITAEDQQALSGQLGQFAGGIAPIIASAPVGITSHVLDKYGQVYDATKGNRKEAGARAAFAGVQDLAFMGLGKLAADFGGKLVPKNALAQWAGKILAGTGMNISVGQLIKASEAALDAEPGKRFEAFQHGLSDINAVDAGAQVGFAVLGARHSMEEAAIHAQRAEQQKLQRANSPQTAAAKAELNATPPVVEGKPPVVEGKPPVKAPSETPPVAAEEPAAVTANFVHTADGGEAVQLNVAEAATPEQLTAFKADIDKSDLAPDQKTQMHQQIDQAIAAKVTAPAVETPAPTPEAAPAAATPAEVTAPAVTTPEVGTAQDYTPALRTAGGEIIPVPKGGTHDPVKTAEFERRADNPDDAMAVLNAEHVFRNEKTGEVVTRDQLNERFGVRDSQGLAKLQQPAEPVTAPAPVEKTVTAPAKPVTEPAPAVETVTPEVRLAQPTEPLKPAPAPRPQAPIAREEAPPAPTSQEIKNQVLAARTPEEKAAAVQASQEREVQLALETGQDPRLNDIAERQGSRDKVKDTQAQVRKALAEKYPAETLAEGATESTVANEITGDKLPKVTEPKLDENGDPVPNTTVTRPKFSNNPDFLAQEIALGNEVVIPEDFPRNQINPALRTEIGADGIRRVTGVETRYGLVDGPEANAETGSVDFFGEYKKDVGTGKAHKIVSVPDDVAAGLSDASQAVNQELADRGLAKDAIELFDQDNPDPTRPEGKESKGSVGNPTKVQENFAVLDLLGIGAGDRKAAPLRRALEAIAKNERFSPEQREQARKILEANHDLGGIKLRRVRDTSTDAAGWWDPNTRTITLNMSSGHEFGIGNTILHEVAHDMIHDNFINPKNDVHKNAGNLTRKIQQKALREAFKESVGREAANTRELEQWAEAQRKDVDASNPFAQYSDRKYYGVAHPEELLATVGTEAPVRELLSRLAPVDAAGPKPKTLLQQLYQAARKLFTGGKTEPASAFDQLMESFADLSAKAKGEKTVAGERGPPVEARGKKKQLSKKEQADLQAELADEQIPESAFTPLSRAGRFETMERIDVQIALVDSGYKLADLDKMSTRELKELAFKTEQGTRTANIDSHSMLGPKGEIIPAPDEDHYRAMVEWLPDHDPVLYEKMVKKFGTGGVGELGQGDFYKFMEDHGYTRVVHGGSEIYASRSGPLPPLHEKMLRKAGEQQGALVKLDDGSKFPKTIYDPEAILSKGTGEKDLPSDPTAVTIKTVLGKGGKTSRNLEIKDTASRADLLTMRDALPDIKGLSEADRKRMGEVLDSKLGPTVVLTKGQAKQRVAYGYDAVQTIANERGRQEANSVALDFGKSKKPTAEALLDRQAMPFIIEAGGDRNQLINDLNRVSNAKEPAAQGIIAKARAAVGRPGPTLAETYTPIVQHALDNFDRLNGKVENYKKIIKEQLERERGVGINTGEIDNYVTRLLSSPEFKNEMGVGSTATGGNRYFMRGRRFEKLADAIAEGYKPQSLGTANPTDIVELTQRRVEAGERLVQQKLLDNELANLKLPDGNPMIGDTETYKSIFDTDHNRVPAGYAVVQTGGRPLVVHNDVKPLFDALYSQGSIPNFIRKTAGFLKRNTLAFDTYHVGRIMFKELAYSAGLQRVGWNKGLSLLEYKDADLTRAVESGDITQAMADYAKKNRPTADLLIKNGLNVGKVADNLAAQHVAAIPGTSKFNPWVFQKLSRGAMLQTAIENYHRNFKRFGNEAEAARQTAKEYNEVFGNLQNQGIFKNKRFQDAARALVLAPGWAESQLMSELRGYGQLAKSPYDLAKGRGLGTVARGQLTAVLGLLAFNQVLNYITTGHSTFENKDGRWFDAFIPGGKRGFWFNPAEIGAEYAFMAHRYFEQHMTPIDVLAQIAENKLGPLGRSAKDLLSGTDYQGKAYQTTKDRIVASLADALPIPIYAGSVIERDPRQRSIGGLPIPGLRVKRMPGSIERQLLQGVGLKVSPEMTPRAEVYALAHPFRDDKGYADNAPSEYRELRTALDNQQDNHALSEIDLLLNRGKTLEQIKKAVPFTRENFTGSATREAKFKKALTAEQRDLYEEAQRDHRANAERLNDLLRSVTPAQREKSKQNKLAQ